MNPETKQFIQTAHKYAVMGGSAVLFVGAVMKLTKVKSFKEAINPGIVALVAAAAFTYSFGSKIVIEKKPIESKFD